MLDRIKLNDYLTRMLAELNITRIDDDALNELTHTVADFIESELDKNEEN